MSGAERILVVDRVEGDTVVLVDDESGTRLEVLQAELALPVREGDVLRVPLRGTGEPRLDWAGAVADEEMTRARLEDARRRLDALRRRDPGGDVTL